MLALGLGLLAAAIWAVHDLLARRLSQGAELVPIVLWVLISGCTVLVIPALIFGDWGSLSGKAIMLAGAAGLAFAVAIGALYRAFSMAPARIVSPIIGAYPVMSLMFATAQGRMVSLADWGSVLAVVAGIAIVALTADHRADPGLARKSPFAAMRWSGLSALAFATTFALGQEAARQGADLPTILITRLVAVLTMGGVFFVAKSSFASLRGNWRLITLMGVFDALALSLVAASGRLPQAEYAAVSASLFGVGTILLASYFLREKLHLLQWAGVVMVFGAIATLTLQN
jgi:drug/metabolite transporter (DMT)-like permease